MQTNFVATRYLRDCIDVIVALLAYRAVTG